MARPQLQIGFKIDEAFEDQLQQALAITGKDRATFAREAVRAAMIRAIDGPEPSDGEPVPHLDLKDAAATIRWLEQTLVEFGQVAGEHQRQSAELRRLQRDDQTAMHRARAEFLEGYPERILKSTKPVHERLAELSGKFDDLPGLVAQRAAAERAESSMQSALEAMTKAGRADRDAMMAEARETRALIKEVNEPRNVTVYNIGLGDWTRGMLAAGSVGLVAIGILAFALLAAILPEGWLAVPVADRVLGGGDRAICRLIDLNYDTGLLNCRATARGGIVTVTASRPKAHGL